MAKGGSGNEKRLEAVMPKDAPPNGDAPTDEDPSGEDWVGPRRRVSEMQAKLHRWAAADPGRRFDDLLNLVHDPATLIVAWDRVATNRGANTAGSDGWTATRIEQTVGRSAFLDDLRALIKSGEFRPEPVRERKIPKPGGSVNTSISSTMPADLERSHRSGHFRQDMRPRDAAIEGARPALSSPCVQRLRRGRESPSSRYGSSPDHSHRWIEA